MNQNIPLTTQPPTTFTNPSGVLIGNYLPITNAPNALPNPTYIGGNPVSAILELQSTTGSLLIPRLTTAQISALVTVTNGMMVYNTDLNTFQGYQNGVWTSFESSSTGVTSISGTANQITASSSIGAVIIGIASNAIFPGTGGVQLPGGTTAQRAGLAGTIRFNSQAQVFESTIDGSTWATIETSSTGVISVSGDGTTITASPTTGLVVVSIYSGYVGQTSITTLGTISTGVWNGTIISPTYGGTGVNNGASTLTLGGSLTTSGAFASTFTMTGITNVTFPTSGTLLTSADAVTSITGTANEVTASASTGAVTLSIPSTFIAPGSIAATTTVSGTTFNSSTLTASTALASDGSKNIVSSLTTATELGYVHGVTSAIQTQINAITASYVTSITGTGNQIHASASTGAVVLSIPNTFVTPGTTTSMGLLTGSAGITVTNGAASIGADSTDNAINIGTGASSGRTITIGNTTGTSGVIEHVGTGNFVLDGVGASTYNIGASTTTGTLTVGGTAQSGLITIGSSSATSIVAIGSGAGATTVNIANNATTSTVNISAATGTTTLYGTNNFPALTASTALVTDGSKNIASSSTTATEIGYVHGVTSAIQTQINAITASYVISIAGTANQITASASTGAITLSTPSTFIAPGTIAAVTSVSAPEYLLTGTTGVISILPQTAAGTYNFNLPITAGTSGYFLTSAGGAGAPMTWTNPGTLGVTSIAGTANQITASASTGAVTLSTPSTFIAPGTIESTGLLKGDAGLTIIGAATNIGADSRDDAINIGTAASSGRTITIGNKTAATGIVERVGTGEYSLDGVGASTYTIGASTTTGTITIGGSSQSGAISIGGSSGIGTLNLGVATGNNTINIANNASGTSTVLIGTTTSGSVTDIYGGLGVIIDGAAATTYLIGPSTTTGTITIGGTAQTGTLTLGSSSGTNIVDLGTGAGITTVNIATGAAANIVNIATGTAANTVNIATGAGNQGVIIGSTTGTSALSLLAGSGAITVNGQFIAINGSTSAPPYSFVNDNTTGLYRASSHVLGICANGTDRLYIGSNIVAQSGTQFVGIPGGTNTPSFSFTGDTSTGIYGTGSGEILFTSAGTTNLFTNAAVTLDVTAGTGGTNTLNVRLRNSAGTAAGNISTAVAGTTTAFNTTSDYRLKKDITPIKNALSTIMNLRPVEFAWIANDVHGSGFIAHELQEYFPEAVNGEKDGIENGEPYYQGVDTSFLIGTLVAALQELNSQIISIKEHLKHVMDGV